MKYSSVCTLVAILLFAVANLSAHGDHGSHGPEPKTVAFDVDAVHSSVNFTIGHLGVSTTHGRFDKFKGEFVQAADPTKSSFTLEIDASSINTGNAKRDGHVKSPDFLDAVQFPTLSFKSTKVKALAGDDLEVTGDFTLHGVTKSITVVARKVGEAVSERMGHKVGYNASFSINRSDYGMTQMLGGIGDEVTIIIAIEGNAK